MNTSRSQALYQKACKCMPGGVNSPVRAFRAVGGTPLYIKRGSGSRIWDEDDNEFIDYVCSWGPLILGHAHPAVVEAVKSAAELGTSFGAPTEISLRLAQTLCEALPSLEMVRMVNSGTEAVMSAVRLARAFTRRPRIVKFEGGYHGHGDALLASSGSGLATLGIPDTPGVPDAVAADTITLPYNDISAVEAVFGSLGDSIAAVIVEPVAGNMGVIPPKEGFLHGLRDITSRHGALLIFDEVITGFRLAFGGAQQVFGITPDLTTLGKIIGGGLPVGAYGGRRDIMEMVAPAGPVYQAGTLSGNPVAMAAGLATLKELHAPGVYQRLESLSAQLEEGLRAAAEDAGVPVTLNRVGSMFTCFFAEAPVTDYASAKRSDTARYARFFWAMAERGVYLAPSQFEAGFVSLAHTPEDIAATVSAAREAFRAAVS
ncbi:MAG: glutamate-1-semialdehyde 2,1-aminomutase [Armatimonadota bacterium]